MLSWQKLLEKLEKEELPTYLTHSPTENNCTINPLTNKWMTKLKRLLVLSTLLSWVPYIQSINSKVKFIPCNPVTQFWLISELFPPGKILHIGRCTKHITGPNYSWSCINLNFYPFDLISTFRFGQRWNFSRNCKAIHQFSCNFEFRLTPLWNIWKGIQPWKVDDYVSL